MRNGTERRNEEASLCNNGLIFLLCGGFFKITKVSRLLLRARNRRIGFSTADLDFDNFRVSHGFVGISYSSRLILLYSNHLEGRQTVENHLVHIGTNSYRCMHVMMSSISILSAFFCGFYFCGSRFVRENRENLHPAKIPRYTVPILPIITERSEAEQGLVIMT